MTKVISVWTLVFTIFVGVDYCMAINSIYAPCSSPKEKNNEISKVNSDTRSNATEMESFPSNCTIRVQCSSGFSYKNISTYVEARCLNGTWTPPIPICQRVCAPLKPDVLNADLLCYLDNERISCDNLLISGTRVSIVCKPKYRKSIRVNSNKIRCGTNGQWSRPLFTCIPECGVRNEKLTPLINNGRQEQLGGSPWQAAIYDKRKNYLLICGGTVVSQRAVVSAAHCFYNTETLQLHNKNNYKVMVGKISREFNRNDSVFQQTFDIERIKYIEEEYYGERNNYLADIAIVTLSGEIRFNDFVLPACIDFLKEFTTKEDSYGIVSGWGYTENGSQPDTLLVTEVQYYSRKQCIRNIEIDDKMLLATDKFCIRSNSSSSVQKGDSGGGLLFLNANRTLYYLRGVVSTELLTKGRKVAIFTDVSKYSDWMKAAINNETINVEVNFNDCPIPKNIKINYIDCEDDDVQYLNSLEKVSHSCTISFSCKNKNESEINHITCVGGRWNPPTIDCPLAEGKTPTIASGTNMNGNELKIDIGKGITLPCFTDILPISTIKWFKDVTSLKVNSNDSRISLFNNNQSLQIEYTIFEDTGTYTCVAENTYGTAVFVNSTTLTIIGAEEVREMKTAWVLSVLCICVILVIICATYLIRRIRAEKRFKKKMKELGLLNFEEGAVESLNPELEKGEQADLLPYDRKWEFPKDRLKFGKQFGPGMFGVVFEAQAYGIRHTENVTPVAVKMLIKKVDPIFVKALATELKTMIFLGRHLNIVNLLGACTQRINKSELLIIFEYCKYGNLRDFLRKYRNNFQNQVNMLGEIGFSISSLKKSVNDPSRSSLVGLNGYLGNKNFDDGSPITTIDLIFWCFQIAKGMEYLADCKVIHGNLCGRNILLTDKMVVKIWNIGLSKYTQSCTQYKRKTQQPMPTRVRWVALESIKELTFTVQSDVWSFGVTMWELFSPFETPYLGILDIYYVDDLYNKLVSGYRLERPNRATNKIYTIMLDCWKESPKLRPSFTRIHMQLGKLLEEGVEGYHIALNEECLKEGQNISKTCDLCEDQFTYENTLEKVSLHEEGIELGPVLTMPGPSSKTQGQ